MSNLKSISKKKKSPRFLRVQVPPLKRCVAEKVGGI
jgi:hypothetical protein